MLTCNLFEIVHNIQLQQSSNKGICLFGATFDNYMHAFKQSSLYYAFLQGGAFGTSRDKNELCMRKANPYGDLVQIAIAIAKYTSSFGLFIKISHLEGEEVFGSAEHKANF